MNPTLNWWSSPPAASTAPATPWPSAPASVPGPRSPRPCARAKAHHALAVDALRDAPLEPILANLSEALKPHGHIMLVRVIAAALDPADPAIAAWARLEGRRPALPIRWRSPER